MITKLKGMFGAGSSGSGPRNPSRLNIQKRFVILMETSSQGSMSRVYKVLDQQTGRTCCLKVQIKDKNNAAAARASKEAPKPPEGEIAVSVLHPHVVRTFEYGETTAQEEYLLMEYIDGHSFQYLRDAKLGQTAQRVEWLAQAAEGLGAVHKAGFIHHDINPRNFLLNREHQVKLIDFGLSIPNTPAFRGPGNRTGTLQYMAPELIRREAIDERIDIFSFGVLAFELLTGSLPYSLGASTLTMLQGLNVEPLYAAKVKPKLSDELSEILRKLVARKKEDRWTSMSTVAEALRSVPVKRQVPVE